MTPFAISPLLDDTSASQAARPAAGAQGTVVDFLAIFQGTASSPALTGNPFAKLAAEHGIAASGRNFEDTENSPAPLLRMLTESSTTPSALTTAAPTEVEGTVGLLRFNETPLGQLLDVTEPAGLHTELPAARTNILGFQFVSSAEPTLDLRSVNELHVSGRSLASAAGSIAAPASGQIAASLAATPRPLELSIATTPGAVGTKSVDGATTKPAETLLAGTTITEGTRALPDPIPPQPTQGTARDISLATGSGQAINTSSEAGTITPVLADISAPQSTPPATPPVLTTPVTAGIPTDTVRMISDAVRIRSENQTITVRLDPPELGSLNIELKFDHTKLVSALLSAELPDTGNLLRRQMDQLQRELSAAGFDGVDIDIEHWDTSSNSDDDDALPTFWQRAKSTVHELPDESTASTLSILTADRIDLRL